MANTIGEIGDIVQIDGFPQKGDVSKGEIVTSSIDDVVHDITARFRRVRVFSTNDQRYPWPAKNPRINITPTGLIPLETESKDRTIPKYRFDFRDRANNIVTTAKFQCLV